MGRKVGVEENEIKLERNVLSNGGYRTKCAPALLPSGSSFSAASRRRAAQSPENSSANPASSSSSPSVPIPASKRKNDADRSLVSVLFLRAASPPFPLGCQLFPAVNSVSDELLSLHSRETATAAQLRFLVRSLESFEAETLELEVDSLDR